MRTLAFIVALLATSPALAQDVWTQPYAGIRLLDRTTSAPNRIHVLEVDLCHPGIRVRATKSSEKGKTAAAFGAAIDAEAVINGDLFSAGFATSGMAVGAGVWWGNADNSSQGYVAFGATQNEVSPPSATHTTPPDWVREMVGGRPQLVAGGVAVPISSGNAAFCGSHDPRTAVGISADGATLWLVVVDRLPRDTGSTSRGMTCSEMASLLLSLGAADALNLDGGGSTQMWVANKGYVNDPSGNAGGGIRVVANHLAIQAGGNGAPDSCPIVETERPPRPALTGSSDINGDGYADACMRGPSGVSCVLGSPSGLGQTITGPALSDASGWSDTSNALSIAMGDVDGDGKADLCARAGAGMRCWLSIGAGFATTPIVSAPFSDANGFGVRQYWSTLQLGDVDGDGKDEVCMRAAARFRCDRADGSYASTTAIASASGFDAENAYGTVQMGDVNGDGKDDVCARNPTLGMRCYLSNGTNFTTEVVGPAWTDASGWKADKYWRTIRLADVNGDGKADLCARTSTDYRCHLSLGTSFGPAIIGPGLANDQGWGDPTNYETIALADLDGDGDLDLCGRADDGVVCWPWLGPSGAGFGPIFTTDAFSDSAGWSQERFYSTIRLVDINGDRKADLCARAAAGWRCRLGTGTSFGAAQVGPAWSDSAGYDTLAAYGTTMSVPSEPEPVVVDPEPGPEPEPEAPVETVDPSEDTWVAPPEDTWVAPPEDTSGTLDSTSEPNGDAAGTLDSTSEPNGDASGTLDTTSEPNGDASGTLDTTSEPNGDASGTLDTTSEPNGDASGTLDTTSEPNGDASGTLDTTSEPSGDASGTLDGTFDAASDTSAAPEKTSGHNDDGCGAGPTPYWLALLALVLVRRRRTTV